MITKQDLQHYRSLRREIGLLRDQLEELQQWLDDAAPKSPAITGMPGGTGDPDKLTAILIRQEELQRKYELKVDEALQLLTDIEVAIDVLEPTERCLIRLRYMKGYSWEAVAVTLGYSLQWTHRIHGRILLELARR